MNKPHFVFDTNVLVSTAVFQGVASKAFLKAKNEGIILGSASTIAELQEVLTRKKFNKYATLESRMAFVGEFILLIKLVNITESIIASRDPKDDKFLELAVNGQANCIISGDSDLTTLSPFRNIPIYTPTVFLELTWETPESE